MLAMVPEEVALKVADLFQTPGTLCIGVKGVEVEGSDKPWPQTTYTAEGMSYWEVWVVAEEIALACRLRRMMGHRDPREEFDTMGEDSDAKVCITYAAHRQNFGWMRKNLSYLETEIACMATARMVANLLFPEGSVT